jgi:hypothetical protein
VVLMEMLSAFKSGRCGQYSTNHLPPTELLDKRVEVLSHKRASTLKHWTKGQYAMLAYWDTLAPLHGD